MSNKKLKDIEVGDMVNVECFSGLGSGGKEKVTEIKTKYNSDTGKPYKVICCGEHMFSQKTGIALNCPTAYYISV